MIPVRVEKLMDCYCGEPLGRPVYHVSCKGMGWQYGVENGCPLGRGATEQLALEDFCYRANADNRNLKLTVKQLTIVERIDYYNK